MVKLPFTNFKYAAQMGVAGRQEAACLSAGWLFHLKQQLLLRRTWGVLTDLAGVDWTICRRYNDSRPAAAGIRYE